MFEYYKAHIIIILSLVVNMVASYLTYHSFLKDSKIFEKEILHIQSKAIQGLIIHDIKTIISADEASNDLLFVDNSLYTKCNVNVPDLKVTYNSLQFNLGHRCIILDISKIREILNQLSSEEYLYNIKINNVLLLTNHKEDISSVYTEEIMLNKDYKILIELICDKNSEFSLNRKNFINQRVLIFTLCSLLVTAFIIATIFLYLKERKKRIGSILHNQKVKNFISEQNKFIIQCYKFSVKQRDQLNNENGDYFPLPILNIKQKEQNSIIPSEICHMIKIYFQHYNQYYNKENIILEFDCAAESEINIPFKQEVLNQILISIIFNLLNFSQKSNNLRHIKLSFYDCNFVFSSNGFKLNKEIATIASQRIFYDSINPFVLNFSQIIGLLNQHGVEVIIEPNDIGSIIKIDFADKTTVIKDNMSGIIDLENYSKKKK